jgi:CheY-like chemotaxis protein
MSNRKPIPERTEQEVLTKSRRRCCICFAIDADTSVKAGQIAHLDQDSSNPSVGNLAFLCFDHHDAYDSTTRQSKNYTQQEVKQYRDDLYQWVETHLAAPSQADPTARRLDQVAALYEEKIAAREHHIGELKTEVAKQADVLAQLREALARAQSELRTEKEVSAKAVRKAESLPDDSLVRALLREAQETCRVLVVEPCVETASYLQRALSAFGNEVVVAKSVTGAIQAADQRRFAVALIEVNLPVEDDGVVDDDYRVGFRLMEELHEKHGTLGIALTVWESDEWDYNKAVKVGFTHHLSKPYSLSAIPPLVRSVAYRLARRE